MARSAQRDDFDVEARRPSVPATLLLIALASAVAIEVAGVFGNLLFGG